MSPRYRNLSDEIREVDEAQALKTQRRALRRLGLSFFVFGMINNVLYVIILSAALDLVPPSTPKGIIAFFNIAPALVAKVGWPYVLKGRIRYAKRLLGCCFLSVFGMMVVAIFDGLPMRLLGIGLASFSSGLGELTFLQLSTTYHPRSISGRCVGYFASGTGAAGLVGAAIWWFVRGLGVRVGVGLSSFMPFIIPLTYRFVLPSASSFGSISDHDAEILPGLDPAPPYAPIPTVESHQPDEEPEEVELPTSSLDFKGAAAISLSVQDKLRLVRPLLLRYMIPLFCVYTFEYTINQGIAPTLIYPVPDPATHPILRLIIKSMRDYYPLWQLVYQIFVFISRSTLSLGIHPLPASLLPLPSILQFGILITLACEAAFGLFGDSESINIPLVFLLISLEGLCGGLAYVNVFYRVGQEKSDTLYGNHDGEPSPEELERDRQEREFKIGSIGFADSLGILLASVIAVPTEVALCRFQVARGKDLCKAL